jgi:AraC-like DNA-binding protein
MLILKREIDQIVQPETQWKELNLPCEERPSDSPFVERLWYSRSEEGRPFLSTAESHGEIVVTKYPDRTTLTVRGPATYATSAYCPPNTEFWGVMFKVGTFMPKFPVNMIMDRGDVDLPEAGSNSFWLDGSAWEFPTFENIDTFINRLVREGLLVHDSVIDVALQEQPQAMSPRNIQRRFLRATGMTYSTIFQIQRAREATSLLQEGVSILDAVDRVGYSDQSHMTRSLKHFMGQTPAQIAAKNTDEPMSVLFKTLPF